MKPEQFKKQIDNMRKQPKGNLGTFQPTFTKDKDKAKGK